MKIITAFVLFACLATARAASYLGPEVGDVAPTFKIEKWLQAPPKTDTWPASKVVVLEFWATWCGPCVAAIPHLNELSEKFKDRPVQFIAVTDESESVVGPFLKKTPIHAWIALSANPIFGDKIPYGIYAIPHTVVIDARGRIAAVTDPRSLNAAFIERCLTGEPLSPAVENAKTNVVTDAATLTALADAGSCPESGVVPGQSQIGRTPAFQVLIRPSAQKKSVAKPVRGQNSPPEINRYSKNPFGLTLTNSSVEFAISFVYDVHHARLVVGPKLPPERYDFFVYLPPPRFSEVALHSGRTLESFFSQAVQATFGVTVKRETRPTDVLVLKTAFGSLEKLARSTNNGKTEMFDCGSLVGTNRSLKDLASGLESAAGKPVIDETGLTNLYSFDLEWDQRNFQHPNVKSMTAAVQRFGLELVPEKRPLELVVVEKAQE